MTDHDQLDDAERRLLAAYERRDDDDSEEAREHLADCQTVMQLLRDAWKREYLREMEGR